MSDRDPQTTMHIKRSITKLEQAQFHAISNHMYDHFTAIQRLLPMGWCIQAVLRSPDVEKGILFCSTEGDPEAIVRDMVECLNQITDPVEISLKATPRN